MLRQIIEILIPVILPCLVYALWLKFARMRALREGHEVVPPWDKGPWVLLIGIGVGLAAVILLVTALETGAPPSSIYHAPVMRNGKVEPGYFEEKN